jgi:hypothetical protein
VKITIESTDRYAKVDGVDCDLWLGTSELGTQCVVFVQRIALHNDDDASEFTNEFREGPPPEQVHVGVTGLYWG